MSTHSQYIIKKFTTKSPFQKMVKNAHKMLLMDRPKFCISQHKKGVPVDLIGYEEYVINYIFSIKGIRLSDK